MPPGQTLSGTKLLLTDNPAKPRKRRLAVISKDAAISLGAGNDSADDPTIAGGTLRVTATAGEAFDASYDLPGEAWRRLGKAGAGKGYALKGAAPIKSVVVKAGRSIKIQGKGDDLVQSLGSDPGMVRVVLTLGAQRYCLAFGGTVKFTPDRKFVATGAPAPVACPASSSPDGAFLE